MEWMLTPAKSFSSVLENVDEQFFAKCASEYALSLVSLVVEQYGTEAATDPDQLSSMLNHPLGSSHLPLWCPELGHCLAALKKTKLSNAQRGLTQIVLNLLSAGIPGTWTIDLAEPMSLRWDRFLLPKALRLEVHNDGKEAHIRTHNADSGQLLEFHAISNGKVEWHSPDAEAIPYLELVDNRALLLSGLQSEEMEFPETVLPGVPAITDTHKRHLSAAIDLFREQFPTWTPWFDRVLRTITVSESSPEGIHSGTREGFYGSIWISDCDDLLKVAESLIHEASHQYYFLLSRLVDLTNDDGRRFYSPFVDTQRPPDKLLLAYHAFTNVEMFYRECLRIDLKAAQCERVLEQLKRELGHTQQVLSKEIDLTPVGRCIFDTLHAYRSSYGNPN